MSSLLLLVLLIIAITFPFWLQSLLNFIVKKALKSISNYSDNNSAATIITLQVSFWKHLPKFLKSPRRSCILEIKVADIINFDQIITRLKVPSVNSGFLELVIKSLCVLRFFPFWHLIRLSVLPFDIKSLKNVGGSAAVHINQSSALVLVLELFKERPLLYYDNTIVISNVQIRLKVLLNTKRRVPYISDISVSCDDCLVQNLVVPTYKAPPPTLPQLNVLLSRFQHYLPDSLSLYIRSAAFQIDSTVLSIEKFHTVLALGEDGSGIDTSSTVETIECRCLEHSIMKIGQLSVNFIASINNNSIWEDELTLVETKVLCNTIGLDIPMTIINYIMKLTSNAPLLRTTCDILLPKTLKTLVSINKISLRLENEVADFQCAEVLGSTSTIPDLKVEGEKCNIIITNSDDDKFSVTIKSLYGALSDINNNSTERFLVLEDIETTKNSPMLKVSSVNVVYYPEVFHVIGAVTTTALRLSKAVLMSVGRFKFMDDNSTTSREKQRIPLQRNVNEIFSDLRDNEDELSFKGIVNSVSVTFPYRLYSGSKASLKEVVLASNIGISVCKERFIIGFEDIRAQGSTDVSSSYIRVSRFAVEETYLQDDSSFIDIVAADVAIKWTAALQLRIFALVKQVTLSAWQMLYLQRSAFVQSFLSPQHSFYHRMPYGINAPLSDPRTLHYYQQKLVTLISASGGKLHRLNVQNITADFVFGHHQNAVVKMTVGRFGGKDLPDLWHFNDITLEIASTKSSNSAVVKVGSVSVRHTIDQRLDYVFGEWEQMLRCRLVAQEWMIEQPTCDEVEGQLVTLSNISIHIPFNFCMVQVVEVIEADTTALGARFADVFYNSTWRPVHSDFYRYFLKLPTQPLEPLPRIWLKLSDLDFGIGNDPMESWLELIYPLWLDELGEQELRQQVLTQQQSALRKTRVDLLSEDELSYLLEQKNAQVYRSRVQKLWSQRCYHSVNLLQLNIKSANVDIRLAPSKDENFKNIVTLDEAPLNKALAFVSSPAAREDDWVTMFSFIFGFEFNVTLNKVTVRCCNFAATLFKAESALLNGFLTICQTETMDEFASQESLCLFGDSEDGKSTVSFPISYVPSKVYVSATGGVSDATFTYGPGYEYALEQLAVFSRRMQPKVTSVLERNAPGTFWDLIRRRCHGQADFTVNDFNVHLLTSRNTFDAAEYLLIKLQKAKLSYNVANVNVEASEIVIRYHDDADSSPLADVVHVKVGMELEWNCTGKFWNHYVYPIGFQNRLSLETKYVLFDNCGNISRVLQSSDVDLSDRLESYRSTKLSIQLSGSMLPPSKSPRTCIMLYGSSIESLVMWVQAYQNVPPYPYPKRRGLMEARKRNLLLNHLREIQIKEFEVSGIDAIFYGSADNTTGIRLAINGSVFCSTVFTNDASANVFNMFSSKRIPLPKTSGRIWAIHDTIFCLTDLQSRIFTPKSGSRGFHFLSVDRFSLDQAKAESSEFLPKVASLREKLALETSLLLTTDSTKNSNVEEEEDCTAVMLKTFQINNISNDTPRKRQAVPISTRGVKVAQSLSSSSDTILSFEVVGIKGLVTVDTVQAIFDIVQYVSQLILDAVPSLKNPPQSILTQTESNYIAKTTTRTTTGTNEHSSLASDPRFASILRGNNIDPPAILPTKAARTHEYKKFFRLQVFDCQFNLRNDAMQECVLVLLEHGLVAGDWEFEKSSEKITVDVKDISVMAAPTDIDLNATDLWIPSKLNAKHRLSGPSLLLPVISPTPITCTVEIDHGATPKINIIRLNVYEIKATLSGPTIQILNHMASGFITDLTSIFQDYEQQEKAKMLRKNLDTAKAKERLMQQKSIANVWSDTKHWKWRLNYFLWLNYSANVAEKLHGKGELSINRFMCSEIKEAELAFEAVTFHLHQRVKDAKKQQQVKPNIDMKVSVDLVSIIIRGNEGSENAFLLDCHVTDTRLTCLRFEDQSGSVQLTCKNILSNNLCNDAIFPQVLMLDTASSTWVESAPILSLAIEVGAPVAGILVVKHFEVNVQPLQIFVMQELILQVIELLSPSVSSHQKKLNRKEKLAKEHFLQEKGSKSIVSAIRTATKKALLKKKGKERDDFAWDHTITTDLELPNAKKREKITGQEELVLEMEDRAKNNITFKHIRMGEINCRLSYASSTSKKSTTNSNAAAALENFRGFELKLHALVYNNQTCTIADVLMKTRKDIVLDILSQVGRNFQNIGTFLRDRLDILRWTTGFESNNSTTKFSKISHEASFHLKMPERKKSKLQLRTTRNNITDEN